MPTLRVRRWFAWSIFTHAMTGLGVLIVLVDLCVFVGDVYRVGINAHPTVCMVEIYTFDDRCGYRFAKIVGRALVPAMIYIRLLLYLG